MIGATREGTEQGHSGHCYCNTLWQEVSCCVTKVFAVMHGHTYCVLPQNARASPVRATHSCHLITALSCTSHGGVTPT